MSSVLVTGATGHLGSSLVPRLLAAGHQVSTLSRSASRVPTGRDLVAHTGDLVVGTGLREALAAVDTVVHCASDPRQPSTDVAGTANLIDAITTSGRPVHLVYVSIVGVDVLPLPYYGAKHAVEKAIQSSPLAWTIQRATQFHSFVDAMVGRFARSPLMPVPSGFAFQPVATAEVAGRLAELVARGPLGRATDFGGPEVISARRLARTWLAARRKHGAVFTVPVPGALGRAFRAGHNLCPDGDLGHVTWQHYLGALDEATGPGVDGRAQLDGVHGRVAGQVRT